MENWPKLTKRNKPKLSEQGLKHIITAGQILPIHTSGQMYCNHSMYEKKNDLWFQLYCKCLYNELFFVVLCYLHIQQFTLTLCANDTCSRINMEHSSVVLRLGHSTGYFTKIKPFVLFVISFHTRSLLVYCRVLKSEKNNNNNKMTKSRTWGLFLFLW